MGRRVKDMSPEAVRRRREIVIMIVVAFVIAILFYLERVVYQSQQIFPFGVNLLFFGLINVNIILMLTLVFLILRNLAKLVFERRQNIFGTKLRTKLVSAFVLFALIPTVLFFYVTMTFITDSIERWFNVQIENSLLRSLEVAQTFYNSFEHNSLYYADRVADDLTASTLLSPRKQEDLTGYLAGMQQDFNLGRVAFFRDADGSIVEAHDEGVPESVREILPVGLIEKGRTGLSLTETLSVGGSEMVYAAAPVYSTRERTEVVGVVAVGYYVPATLVSKTQEIRQSYEEYRQLKMLKSPIKASYLIILILITIMILFSATWFGFYLARGLTRPVQRLAEGMQGVADGNLDFSLPVEAGDEFGQLVLSFNKMTSDLKGSKEETLHANEDLRAKNVELDQRRRYTETVLRNITAGVISLDADGVIETANRTARRLVELDEDPVGRYYGEVLGEHHAELIQEVLRESETSGRETIAMQEELTSRGRIVTVFISCSRLTDEDDKHMGYVLVLEDLTDLLKAQRMAAWQEVARRIAHEIKNPLTPIQLSAQRLQKRYTDRIGDDSEVFTDCTNMIIRQVEEMKQLVNEFSKFARMAEIKPEPGDLNAVIEEAVMLYQEGHKELAFELQADRAIPRFRFDRDQIKRVLINLLDNAVAATPGEGTISVTTKLRPALHSAVIEIADNGEGIPREYRNRLFEPYFSTKRRGTGLGLAIVNRIVQDHNGYIRIRDNEPRGTVVSIELPLGTKDSTQVA